jgi:hypothetical protein
MPEPSDLPAVAALLEERNALRGWLDRLDRSGASAPESVRARVRQDYQARLDGVTERLRQHADAIAARLSADTAERDQLEQRARAAREALAEAELRHAVGEYDDARFEDETRRHNAGLEECELALNEVMERIAHLEDVHAAVTRPAPAAESVTAVEPTPDPMAEPVADIEVVEQVTVESTEELLSIFSPVDEPPAASDPVPFEEDAIRFEEAASTESSPVQPGFGPLSFTPSDAVETTPVSNPVRNSPAPSRTPPPIGMPLPDSSPRFVRPATDRGSELVEVREEEIPPVRVVPDPEPVLPELNRETEAAARTLRCGECGAMNRPLEWYCEKCGAELNSI